MSDTDGKNGRSQSEPVSLMDSINAETCLFCGKDCAFIRLADGVCLECGDSMHQMDKVALIRLSGVLLGALTSAYWEPKVWINDPTGGMAKAIHESIREEMAEAINLVARGAVRV